jgi:hypothetical protein
LRPQDIDRLPLSPLNRRPISCRIHPRLRPLQA